jgi:hypothetical protein
MLPLDLSGKVALVTGVWPCIQRVVAAVVRHRTILIVTTLVAVVARTLNATLTSEKAFSLGSGGRLYRRPGSTKHHLR